VTDLRERIYLGVLSEEVEAEGGASAEEARETLAGELAVMLGEFPELEEMGFSVEAYLEELEEAVGEYGELFKPLRERFSWRATERGRSNGLGRRR
jgi:hypothetical protein